MNICSSGPFLLCLASPTFPRVSHLLSCVTSSCLFIHLPFFSISVSLRVSAWLTQGTTPAPNTAELKQTHFARMKTNHFLLAPSLSLLFPLMLFLSSSLLFSPSENKLPGLYLFYQGRPDHHRESFKLLWIYLSNSPVRIMLAGAPIC